MSSIRNNLFNSYQTSGFDLSGVFMPVVEDENTEEVAVENTQDYSTESAESIEKISEESEAENTPQPPAMLEVSANESTEEPVKASKTENPVTYATLGNTYATMLEDPKNANDALFTKYHLLLGILKKQIAISNKNQNASKLEKQLTAQTFKLCTSCDDDDFFSELQQDSKLKALITLDSTIRILDNPNDTDNQKLISEIYDVIKDDKELGAQSPLAIALGSIVLAIGTIIFAAALIATAGAALPLIAGLSTAALTGIALGGFTTAGIGTFTLSTGLMESKIVAPVKNMHHFFESEQYRTKQTAPEQEVRPTI